MFLFFPCSLLTVWMQYKHSTWFHCFTWCHALISPHLCKIYSWFGLWSVVVGFGGYMAKIWIFFVDMMRLSEGHFQDNNGSLISPLGVARRFSWVSIATTGHPLWSMYKFILEISFKSEEWQKVIGTGCDSAGSTVPWWTGTGRSRGKDLTASQLFTLLSGWKANWHWVEEVPQAGSEGWNRHYLQTGRKAGVSYCLSQEYQLCILSWP